MSRILTVVHIEDDPAHQLALERILSNIVRVKLIAQVTTGKDTLRICPEMHPDIIIVDVNVPDMSAAELLTQLIELCPTSTIITTSVSNDPEKAMMLLGVRYFLTKPLWDLDVLDTLINIDKIRRESME